MRVRKFVKATDYPDAVDWWADHSWPVIPPQMLPELGLVAEDDGFKYCMGWLYRTDSKICWLEYIVANPDAPLKKRSKAIDLLIEGAIFSAKEMGYKVIFSSLKSKGLMRRFNKQGFVYGDNAMTNMIWRG